MRRRGGIILRIEELVTGFTVDQIGHPPLEVLLKVFGFQGAFKRLSDPSVKRFLVRCEKALVTEVEGASRIEAGDERGT